jgi:RND family efflux transporter MFP subunit
MFPPSARKQLNANLNARRPPAPPQENQLARFTPGVILLAGGIGLLVMAGCGDGPPSEPLTEKAAELPTLTAHVQTIDASPWPTTVRTQGNLVADEVVVVGARVAGRVAEVQADLGDFVSKGSPLVMLDQKEFRLAVSQAEAALLQARSSLGLALDDEMADLDPKSAPPVREQRAIWDEAQAKRARIGQLAEQDAVTEADVEQAVAAERVAEARYAAALNAVNEKIALVAVRAAELDLARQRLADTVVLAPFEGLVQQRYIAPGSFVQVGQDLISLVRTNPLRFRGSIPERYAQRLQTGQTVRLKIESVPGIHEVEVTRVSPSLNEQTRSLTFEALLDNSERQLRSGLFAEGELVLDAEAESLSVPISALTEFAGTEKVWKLVDGVSREQTVVTGKQIGNRVEIVEGLQPGDRILLEAERGMVARVEPIAVEEDLELDPRTIVARKTAAEPAEAGSNDVDAETSDELDVSGGP